MTDESRGRGAHRAGRRPEGDQATDDSPTEPIPGLPIGAPSAGLPAPPSEPAAYPAGDDEPFAALRRSAVLATAPRPHWPDEPYPRAARWRRALAGPIARSVALSGVAVVVVAALIAVVWVAYGGQGSARSVLRPPATRAAGHTTPGHRSSGGSPAASGVPAATTSSTPTAQRSAPPPVTQSTAPAMAPLLVLNNSTVQGLAAKAAADFEAGGWTVSGVGNYTGRIDETTAYYGPGGEAAARALAARFPAITRVLPRFAGLPGSGLTVVVTRYYPH